MARQVWLQRAFWFLLIALYAFIIAGCSNQLGDVGDSIAAERDQIRTPILAPTSDYGVLPETPTPEDPLVVSTQPSLQQALRNHGSAETAVRALEAIDTTLLFQPGEQVTILVPVDGALANFSAEVANTMLGDVGPQSIWHLHILPGALTSADIGSRAAVTTRNGASHQIGGTPMQLYVRDALVVSADVPFNQGVIHFIDRVLLP